MKIIYNTYSINYDGALTLHKHYDVIKETKSFYGVYFYKILCDTNFELFVEKKLFITEQEYRKQKLKKLYNEDDMQIP